MREHLERIYASGQPTTALTYDEAIQRAEWAGSFVVHPYWEIMSRMLAGTIKSETEQLLAGGEHEDVNRASVGICRKVIQMPFFDIEQGQLAEGLHNKAKARLAMRRSYQSGSIPPEVQ